MLLLDEPLSALDAKIRVSLREEIRAIQRELGITTIYVTHDQEEALSMSDRIVVMNAGVAEQVGDPFEIYNRPATAFVASFVGTLNVARGPVTDPATGAVDGRRPAAWRSAARSPRPPGATVALALRPQALALGRAGRQRRRPPRHGRGRELPRLGRPRPRRASARQRVSLDIFNTIAMRPPALGETVEISFATADALVTEA